MRNWEIRNGSSWGMALFVHRRVVTAYIRRVFYSANYRGGEKVSVLFPHRHRHHQRCCDGDVLCYNFTNTGRIPVFLGALQSRDPCRSNAPKNTVIRPVFVELLEYSTKRRLRSTLGGICVGAGKYRYFFATIGVKKDRDQNFIRVP